jgi:long-chain fatty acid transport protein
LNASGKGIGFTAGVLFQLADNFHVGGRYQQKVELDLQGKNEYGHGNYNRFNDIAPVNTPEVDTSKPEFYSRQKAVFFLPLPSEVVVGVLLAPAKRFSFQADVQRTDWSSFKKWEFIAANPEESFFFEPSESEEMDDEPTEGAREGVELNMKDTWSFKLGGEYYLKEELSLRIGYARHESPFDDKNLTPVLPLLPRNVFSFGMGYDGPVRSIADKSLIGNLTFDAYVQYVMFEEKTSSYPDHPLTFGGDYWVFGVGVGFNL